MAALGRFVSRRGKPIEIYSDNGANFLKAWKILKRGQEREQKEVMNNFCAENNIVWHFNPPYAPFMGGRWEAQIKILKKHLKATIANIILPYEHLNSLLIQIEAIMNSGPISPLSSDPSDIMPLTPSHFLIGQSLTSLPSSQERQQEFDLIVNLKLIKERENHFWNRWKKEYLNHLQQRHKWFSSIPNVKIGDLVMIKQPSPILVWKLGRVVRLFMGRDKKCRVVEVLTSKGVYTRPISWISPLPISYHEYPHEQEKC